MDIKTHDILGFDVPVKRFISSGQITAVNPHPNADRLTLPTASIIPANSTPNILIFGFNSPAINHYAKS